MAWNPGIAAYGCRAQSVSENGVDGLKNSYRSTDRIGKAIGILARCKISIALANRSLDWPRPGEGALSQSLSIPLILQEMVGGAHPTGALSRGICRGNRCGQSRGKMPLLRCICLYPARRTAVQDAHLTTAKGRCGGTLGDFYRTGSTIALTIRSVDRYPFV